MSLFFIFACVVPTEETTWSGNVYGLFAAQLETAAADLNLLSTDGTLLTSSETPYSDSPQYHVFSLEPDLLVQDVQILVSGADFYPTLYIGTTPQNSAIWLNGALYGYGTIWTESFFLSLGLDIESPSTQEMVQLIGRPSLPEDWSNVVLTLIQENGVEKEVLRFRYDETGFLLGIDAQAETESIDLFVCTDINPGSLTLLAEHSDGRTMEIRYHAQGGTIINAEHLLFSKTE